MELTTLRNLEEKWIETTLSSVDAIEIARARRAYEHAVGQRNAARVAVRQREWDVAARATEVGMRKCGKGNY